ncbi:hypothetical protein Btru_054851 [Bulinus truncatus]|nr:hypothetical protein Btru_054851 [Bulinus truncatus]
MNGRHFLDTNWTLGPSSGQMILGQHVDHNSHLTDGVSSNCHKVNVYSEIICDCFVTVSFHVYLRPETLNERVQGLCHKHGKMSTNQDHKLYRPQGMSRSLPSVMSQIQQGVRLNDGKKVIFLKRHSGGQLGLGIQGGQEYNSPVFVSVPGEQGKSQGLRSGDKILNINGTDFSNITHAEAVTVIQSAWNVLMLVEHKENIVSQDDLHHASTQPTHQEMHLFIYPTKKGKLGCGVQRDTHGGLKIVTVDKDSPASRAGLCPADNLIEIEGLNVSTITDQQVFALIQDMKRICVKINRHTCNVTKNL